jgi:formylglycine-generating enzyme required for sulfatase activity
MRLLKSRIAWLGVALAVLPLLAVLGVVIQLLTKKEAELKKSTPASRAEPEFLTSQVGQIQLKRIPAGRFQMGSPAGEGHYDERPHHEVRITKPFYLGIHEVTQGQYQAVMGRNPSRVKGSFRENSENRTHPIGQKQCNGFRLYDMHGNVWEWCWDGFAVDYYQQAPTDDPRGPRQAGLRVIRGGSYGYDPRNARSAARACRFPEHHIEDLGFRVVRGPSGP